MKRCKDFLWDLLDVFSMRRLTTRVALGAGLLALAASPSSTDAGPRVPIAPALAPDPRVRKFNGRYILKRNASSFFMHLAGHRSHSSHSSHRSHSSHSSHSSSSHYSGAHASHYSSSTPPAVPPPAPRPAPPPPITPEPVAEPNPEPTITPQPARGAIEPQPIPAPPPHARVHHVAPPPPPPAWHTGVVATPQSTYDSYVRLRNAGGRRTIAPRRNIDGEHFNGYYSSEVFDLARTRVAVELRRAASGGRTLFAAAR
ncbi:MAG TPA: hypothetical protein VM733_12730, partial [Thermoanaerobaculia bacterium]|nr:hypothetical protein [Thermoanaerobaculia bacterium]